MDNLKPKPPITQELAPASTDNTIAYTIDPFLKVLLNPDKILATKGAGNLEIYQEVLRDDQVKATFQQRRLSVVSKPWTVEAGADDAASQACADALRDNLSRIRWDDINDKMLFATFYGYGVGEIMWAQHDGLIGIESIKVRERARFRFNVDSELFLLRQDHQFERMPDRKFWVVSTGADNSDNPYGLGLAHWLYWPVFFKRNDIKFWLIFLEKFGQPTGVGKLPAGKENDKDTRNKALQALRAIATETGILVPDGMEITLLEARRSGAADYEALKDAMDAAIAKIVLSQTMTTDNGSSRSQSETHADVRDMVVQADSDMLCESFNQSVVQWWFEYNQAAFAGATPPRVYRNVKPAEDQNKRAERDKKISELGYEPTPEYITSTYGEGWIKKQAQVNQIGQLPVADPNAANFAESAVIDAIKAGARGDQVGMLDAAQRAAEDYQSVMGQRVQQLLDYAESSKDFDTFEQHLREMARDMPSAQAVQKIERATFWARLTGMLRGQR
jgi:phage gp29-like protein